MSNKPSGLLRGGRRKSTSTSPTSPTFPRRLNQSQDVLFPLENGSTESPSIDLTVPSPTFDIASISPTLAAGNRFTQRPQSNNRASDDFGKSRPKFLSETARPATSSAEGSNWSTTPTRYSHSPEKQSSRGSPSLGGTRLSSEGFRISSSRENQDAASGSSFRSANFLSQHDRSGSDEGAGIKAITTAKKSLFSLKSPRNLFARRRSSQNASKLDDGGVGIGKMHVPAMPDNIETSIRGNRLHDFSKPRPRGSNNDSSPLPVLVSSPGYPRRQSEMDSPLPVSSMSTPISPHAAMFTEHFQEEKRPVQPTNTGYLHSPSLRVPPSNALPVFAPRQPLRSSGEKEMHSSPPREPLIDNTGINVTSTQLQQAEAAIPVHPSPPTEPPPPPPAPASALEEELPSPVLDLPPVDTLPKHMTSTSSRFSFQIGQQGSIAQEKVLEERHKEHAMRKPATIRMSVASIDDFDDYDYDDMDDEDGFDNDNIEIKNVDEPSSQYPPNLVAAVEEDDGNTGYVDEDYGDAEYADEGEDDEFDTSDIVVRNINMPTNHIGDQRAGDNYDTKRQSLQAFHFTPQSLCFSPSTVQNTSMSTPRDTEGFAIGKAECKEGIMHNIQPQIRDSLEHPPDATFFEGLGISTLADDLPDSSFPLIKQQQNFDDLYFDDGEFGDNIVESGAEFDEEMLDNAEHIRDIPLENARKYDEAMQRSLYDEQAKVVSGNDRTNTLLQTPDQKILLRAESSQSSENGMFVSSTSGLTEGNLAAYHDALAQAATQAAENGKFDRVVSFSRISDDGTDSPFQNSVPALSSRGSKYSNHVVESGISDEDGYGLDDDMDDEAMIAAANAEALENDDDGFYGQEFGFYARAHGKDSAEFASGGYFTSRGSNGIKRSHSGKNNFQEPSLTPITERSEWSARNSVISLPMHSGMPGSLQAVPSPSTILELLSQDVPITEDEMSWASLSKLRSRTFGGSSTSVNSLPDRNHTYSSPLAHLSGFNLNHSEMFNGKLSSPAPGTGGVSIAESEDEDEDEDEEWGRPTLTQNTPHKRYMEPATHLSPDINNSPLGRKGHHSRNSSGAESVSYARDADGRWVLERRRTGEDGELELVEREYLAGARI